MHKRNRASGLPNLAADPAAGELLLHLAPCRPTRVKAADCAVWCPDEGAECAGVEKTACSSIAATGVLCDLVRDATENGSPPPLRRQLAFLQRQQFVEKRALWRCDSARMSAA